MNLPKRNSEDGRCYWMKPEVQAELHPLFDRWFGWYQNLADEACAMPGSFAVFALGLEGEQRAPLVTEYLDFCDDEHSSLQGKFLHAFIRKFGFQAFQPWTLGVLVWGALPMQWLEPAKAFRSLIATAESYWQSSTAFSFIFCRKKTKSRNSGPSLGRAYSGPSGARPLKTVAARPSRRLLRS